MPRTARAIEAGTIYHVLNRGNGRVRLFHKDDDYAAFERVLREDLDRYPVDLLTYCLIPNHWHLVGRPREDDALGRLMGWVGVTHVRRHHAHYHTRGGGHLYQGRFKSFPTQNDRHFLTLCRYVEANALRGGLVRRIVSLASKFGRYGYRRITALLRREGWRMNHKRVERIWRQEGLKVPQRQAKRGCLWFNDGSCLRVLCYAGSWIGAQAMLEAVASGPEKGSVTTPPFPTFLTRVSLVIPMPFPPFPALSRRAPH